VAYSHNRVSAGNRIAGKGHASDLGRPGGVGSGELEHRFRCIGRHHPEPGINQVASEQPAPAADLDNQAVAFPHRFEESDDSWSAGVGVEPETKMVHECQIVPVIGHIEFLARLH
jgi:hypothetical protein